MKLSLEALKVASEAQTNYLYPRQAKVPRAAFAAQTTSAGAIASALFRFFAAVIFRKNHSKNSLIARFYLT